MNSETSETQVLSLDAFRRKKRLNNETVFPSAHINSHLEDANDDAATPARIRMRMDRIKTTVQRINTIMEELKGMSNQPS